MSEGEELASCLGELAALAVTLIIKVVAVFFIVYFLASCVGLI